MHQQSLDSPVVASAIATPVLGESVSSSSLSTGRRKVRLSDFELFQRVQRVAVPNDPINLQSLSARRGWKHARMGVSGGMDMYYRSLSAAISTPPFQTQQFQVVIGGEVQARATELQSLLRAPTESESNALLHALYGSHFIYSSLVHAVPSLELGSGSLPPGTNNGQQLMVRTVSFARSRLTNPFKQRSSTPVPRSDSRTTSDSRSSGHQLQTTGSKNEQFCYVELMSPTCDGFKIAFCSLDAVDVMTGKAPAERVIALYPISGWLTAESTPDNSDTVRVTFQASFPGEVPGGCDSRIAQDRLLFLAKGVCRLGNVLHRRRQSHTVPARVWQTLLKPFRVFSISDEVTSEGAHRNWHCIACTRSFLPTLRKSWRRCDLCAYRVCADPPCCSHERVAIYSRYVAPLLVCARCRECIDERDGGHHGSRHRVGSATGDSRYAGFSLRVADQGNDLEPELELDPPGWGHDQFEEIGASAQRQTSAGSRKRQRAQTDPLPVLGLAFSSSEEDDNLS